MGNEENKSKPTLKNYAGGMPSKYKPEYCQMLIDHMKEGLSYETFATIPRCCRDTLYAWEKAHPEFLEAKKTAFLECRIFWEKLATDNMINSNGVSLNTGLWIFNMKNRFKWTDRMESEVKVEGTLESLVNSSMQDKPK